MMLFAITVGAIAIAMFIMAVGVIFKNRALRGSCGGPDILDPNGDPITCGACPKRKDHGIARAMATVGITKPDCEFHHQ